MDPFHRAIPIPPVAAAHPHTARSRDRTPQTGPHADLCGVHYFPEATMRLFLRHPLHNLAGIWGDIIAAVLKHLYTSGRLHNG